MELHYGIIFMKMIPGMPGTSPETPGIPGIPWARTSDHWGRSLAPGHAPGTPRHAPGTPGHAPRTPREPLLGKCF